MWKFFHQTISPQGIPPSIPYKDHINVSSIFLISRSSCAFVNLESQDDLLLAITYFNGRALRPLDSRCPKLVCRVRKMDDDLKAGVGGQRGSGIHTKYVKDSLAKEHAELEKQQQQQQQQRSLFPSTDSAKPLLSPTSLDPSPPVVAPLDVPSETVHHHELNAMDAASSGGITPAAFAAHQRDRSQSGTHSFASTNSSFLARYFPKRYFILKSRTLEELEMSTKEKTWSTQLHNEAILGVCHLHLNENGGMMVKWLTYGSFPHRPSV